MALFNVFYFLIFSTKDNMQKHLITLLFINILVGSYCTSLAQNGYKNRFSINVLGLPSGNVVASYERSFSNQSLWLGYNYFVQDWAADDDNTTALQSIALEYRYYFFPKEHYSNGVFAGAYTKYRSGEEASKDFPYTVSYNALFAGLNAGYQYTYKHLTLSGFIGYGFLMAIDENTSPNVLPASSDIQEKDYKKDFRLGVMLGVAF